MSASLVGSEMCIRDRSAMANTMPSLLSSSWAFRTRMSAATRTLDVTPHAGARRRGKATLKSRKTATAPG
eukprot:13333591-Alexandrium_andersonii.AAC.1